MSINIRLLRSHGILGVAGSVLLGSQAGSHRIEGVGIGYTPPLWQPTLVDDILPVRTDDAKDMARRLAREEALFAGTSSGANVVAAIQVPVIQVLGGWGQMPTRSR